MVVQKPPKARGWGPYVDALFDEHNTDNARLGTVETALTVVREAPLSLKDPRVGCALDNGGDESAKVATALSLLPAAGGHIYHPPGILRTSAISFDRPVLWQGAGDQASVIKASLGFTGTLVTIGPSAPYSRMSDVAIAGGGSAAQLLSIGVARVRLANLELSATGTGTNGAALYFNGTDAATASPHAIQCDNIRIINCDGIGLFLRGFAYDNEFTNLWIGSCLTGIRLENTNTFFTNTHVWGSTGNGIEVRSGLQFFENCYVETNGSSGFNIFNAPNVKIANTDIWANGVHGVYVESSDRFSMIGGIIYDQGSNGINGVNTQHGKVIGVDFYDVTSSSRSQDRPIVTTGTSDKWIVMGNTMLTAEHAVGGVSMVGSNNVVANNVTA